MARQVTFKLYNGNSVPSQVEVPERCSTCGYLVVLTQVDSIHNPAKHPEEFQVVFKCPNQQCKSFVIAWYHGNDVRNLTLTKIEPPHLTRAPFPQSISDISPDFLSIFAEAHEAKERGLKQIAGPGFRKAFEFLVKDYAKSLSTPDKHQSIENLFAGNVVTQFIPDARIQAVAKRALWLGNDETHYLRKWKDHDINDLVTLINLTIHWIEIEQQSKAYAEEMPDKATG